jgi:hypothetical protein
MLVSNVGQPRASNRMPGFENPRPKPDNCGPGNDFSDDRDTTASTSHGDSRSTGHGDTRSTGYSNGGSSGRYYSPSTSSSHYTRAAAGTYLKPSTSTKFNSDDYDSLKSQRGSCNYKYFSRGNTVNDHCVRFKNDNYAIHTKYYD